MAAAPLSVTAEREGVVDFTTPYYDFAGTQILMKKTESHPGMFAFSTVFRSDVWLCWGSVLTATGLFIALFDRLSPNSYRNKPEAYSSGRIFSIAESMWFVIGSFTLFGESVYP